MNAVRIDLSGVAYPEGGWWIAHCLQLDIAAEGRTASEAFDALKSLCDFQIETAVEKGDLPSIFRPAPAEIWGLYATAKDSDKRLVSKPGQLVNRFETRELCAA